eukprot:3688581-Lingulodinium_polyedra.AAC.1
MKPTVTLAIPLGDHQANESVALSKSNRATRATYRTFARTDAASLLSATVRRFQPLLLLARQRLSGHS